MTLKLIKLLVGCPASGKTSYAHNVEKACEAFGNLTYRHISRDAIRFSLVEENEDYFSKEKEVFETFVSEVQKAIDDKINVIVMDATHVSEGSRRKILSRLTHTYGYELEAVVFDVPLETLKERNQLREGRARVPDSAIENMYYNFSEPTIEELQNYQLNVIPTITFWREKE
jgi:predicted kinase